MIQRCHNPKDPAYSYYGSKGITVCDPWRYSFKQFCEDMGERPHGYELDRKDNHKGYEPGNCHWTTKTKQQANRKTWKISKSGYRGVEVRGKRFVAKVGQREPYRYVAGYFANAAEAAWMRDQWAMAIYGDSAVLNFEYL